MLIFIAYQFNYKINISFTYFFISLIFKILGLRKFLFIAYFLIVLIIQGAADISPTFQKLIEKTGLRYHEKHISKI